VCGLLSREQFIETIYSNFCGDPVHDASSDDATADSVVGHVNNTILSHWSNRRVLHHQFVSLITTCIANLECMPLNHINRLVGGTIDLILIGANG
jgi:hypothetical protein